MDVRYEKMGNLEMLSYEGLTWVNVENPTSNDIDLLAQNYPLSGRDLEQCLSKIQLTKIDDHRDHLFIVLHFPILNSQGVILSSQLSIFLATNYLITIHGGDLKPLVELFQSCKNEKRHHRNIMDRGSSYVLYRILSDQVDLLFPMLDKIMSHLESIEDKVFDEKTAIIREVTFLRREIADLRRVIFTLKSVTLELEKKALRFATHQFSYKDVNERIQRVWETLEEFKETIEIYKDTDFMLSTERSNKILAVLTIVFTLSIPATVVAAFYGMNINLPGGIETGSWLFLGPYTTLIILVIVSVLPAALMYWLFRRYGWI